MFGKESLEPPTFPKREKRSSLRQDILIPSSIVGHHGHFARDPNTSQHVQLFHYQQQKSSLDKLREESAVKEKLKDAIDTKFEIHAVKKRNQRAIQERVKEKFKIYEESVEKRREKLLELLSAEERQYYYETVDAAQKGVDRKMEEMKLRAETLKAKRENERMEIVHQKRVEQYRERCQQLRPRLAKLHLIESKYSQLQQIRENEARREADRELDKMWHELTLKEVEARKEREIQEMLKRRSMEKEMLKTWDMQIRGKELLKEEMDKVAHEDRLEMEKLSEQIRREEIEALDAKRKKRDAAAQEILDQLEIQKKLQAQRKKEENAIEGAFSALNKLEVEREKASFQNTAANAKKEMAMYRKHLKDLEDERKLEEKKLMGLLEFHRKEVEAKQMEARCKIVEAKRQLQRDVLAERAEQIKYKKQEAEEQLKLKQAENELLRMAFETNERLQAESDRLEKQAAIQYREDLQRQIDYNNVLRQREKEELERQLQEGLEEEKKYQQIVELMLSGEIEITPKHPFRRTLEQYNCSNPNNC